MKKLKTGDLIYHKVNKTVWEVLSVYGGVSGKYIDAKSITSGQVRNIENTLVYELLDNMKEVKSRKLSTLAYIPEHLYSKVKECHSLRKFTLQSIADYCFIHRRTIEKYFVDPSYKDCADLIKSKQFIRSR